MAVKVTLEDKLNKGRQYRAMKLEIREDGDKPDSCIVEGYATTFNEPYTLWAWDDCELREVIAPEAFRNCDMSDVIMQYDHQGHVFARTKNGTLMLTQDEHGLKVHAELGGTTEGRKLYEEIKGGYTDKMSFGFTVKADETLIEEKDGKTVYTRTIREIDKLYDVSAVSLPANDGTEISARSFVDGVIAKRQLDDAVKDEEEKKKAEAIEAEKKKEDEERARMIALLSFNLN